MLASGIWIITRSKVPSAQSAELFGLCPLVVASPAVAVSQKYLQVAEVA